MTTETKPKLQCPKCNDELEFLPNMYASREQTFPGSICKKCNSLWPDNCPGYTAFMEAVNMEAVNASADTQPQRSSEEEIEVLTAYIFIEKIADSYGFSEAKRMARNKIKEIIGDE